MERLTYRYEDGMPWVSMANVAASGEFECIGPAIDRLAAYEDTGLEPQEIKELCTDDVAEVAKMFRKMIESGEINHMQDLLQAEQDGQLVVLPCRRGDRLFVLTSDSPDGIEETKCKRITIVNRWDRPTARVIVKCVYDDWGKAVREFLPEDFGKTVFLTREEAEAELKGESDG